MEALRGTMGGIRESVWWRSPHMSGCQGGETQLQNFKAGPSLDWQMPPSHVTTRGSAPLFAARVSHPCLSRAAESSEAETALGKVPGREAPAPGLGSTAAGGWPATGLLPSLHRANT